jgi:hypothetical protein
MAIHKAMTHCLGRPSCPAAECSDLDPFDNWKHLAKHRRQHHREGLWLCDGENCSRNFTSYLDLQSHMNLIHAERKWVCLREDCYFYQQNRRLTELAYKRHLTEHAIMDNPEATQPCLMCGMHVIVSKVAAHIAHYHTESVQCRNAQCEIAFTAKDNRLAHEWIVHGMNAKDNAPQVFRLHGQICDMAQNLQENEGDEHLEIADTNLTFLTEQTEQDPTTSGDKKTFLLPRLFDLLEEQVSISKQSSNNTATLRQRLFLSDLLLAPEEVCILYPLCEF